MQETQKKTEQNRGGDDIMKMETQDCVLCFRRPLKYQIILSSGYKMSSSVTA